MPARKPIRMSQRMCMCDSDPPLGYEPGPDRQAVKIDSLCLMSSPRIVEDKMAIFFAMGTSTRLSTQRFCAWQHGDGSDVLTACCSDTALLILSSPIKMKARPEMTEELNGQPCSGDCCSWDHLLSA